MLFVLDSLKMTDAVEEDSLNLEADVNVVNAPNGKHWYYKVQKFFKARMLSSESNQARNSSSYSVFERR